MHIDSRIIDINQQQLL